MKRSTILMVLLILLVSTGGGFVYSLFESEDERPRSPLPMNHVNFDGTITWNGSFHLDGMITLGGLDRNVTEFRNASVKLYSDNREFMDGRCLGIISGTTQNDVSITYDERPSYVLFVSPDYWHPDRVEHFQAINYEWEDDQYVPYVWGEPSGVDVNPIAHDPCAG